MRQRRTTYWNVPDGFRDLFRRQCLQYLDEARERAAEECFQAVVDELHARYQLRCRALDLIAVDQLERSGERTVEKVLAVHKLFAAALDTGNTVGVLAAFGELHALDARLGQAAVLAHIPDMRRPRPHDSLSWNLLALGDARAPMLSVDRASILERIRQRERRGEKAPAVLTPGQREAMRLLSHFYSLHRATAHVAGVSTRPIPLVAAPSGTGKTFLIEHFARERGLPILSLDYGSWICSGAYTKPATFERIARFVSEHEEKGGVLHLDEMDKYGSDGSGWSRAVQQELFALLDGRLTAVPGWTARHTERLRRFFMVGSGAWQHLFRAPQAIGFTGASSPSRPYDIGAQDSIPEELVARFNANFIYLRPPGHAEFKERIEAISRELRIEVPPEIDALAADAVRTGGGMCWLEAYLSRLLLDGSLPSLPGSPAGRVRLAAGAASSRRAERDADRGREAAGQGEASPKP